MVPFASIVPFWDWVFRVRFGFDEDWVWEVVGFFLRPRRLGLGVCGEVEGSPLMEALGGFGLCNLGGLGMGIGKVVEIVKWVGE